MSLNYEHGLFLPEMVDLLLVWPLLSHLCLVFTLQQRSFHLKLKYNWATTSDFQ